MPGVKIPNRPNTIIPTKANNNIDLLVKIGILKMFLMGVSTRKEDEVIEEVGGFTFAAGYVSKLAKRLNDEVRKFFDRPLTDDFVYLFLDGIVVKVRDVSRSVKRTVFVAYGIRKNE